jgi:hypothetical protein
MPLAVDLLVYDGILVLSGTRVAAQKVAHDLGLPIPPPGGFVPVKVTRAEPNCPQPTSTVNGVTIRRWQPGDNILGPETLKSLSG